MSDPTDNAVPKQPSRSRGDAALRAAGFTAVAGLIAIFGLSLPATSKALAQATTKQPETYSELYFTDHTHLPSEMPARQITSVKFHIANHEARAVAYRPRITVFENGRVQSTTQTLAVIDDGGGQDLTAQILPAQAGDELELVIDLPEQNQSIHLRSRS